MPLCSQLCRHRPAPQRDGLPLHAADGLFLPLALPLGPRGLGGGLLPCQSRQHPLLQPHDVLTTVRRQSYYRSTLLNIATYK